MSNTDKILATGDKKTNEPNLSAADIYRNESAGLLKGGVDVSANHQAANDVQVKAGNLPALTIHDHTPAPAPARESHWWSGALAVANDFEKGAANELTEHPGHVFESVAIGAVAGVGLTLIAPEAAAVITLVGAGYAAYKLGENMDKWVSAAKTVGNENGHSQVEIDAAHSTLQKIGGGTVDIAAGVAGGSLASAVTDGIINGDFGTIPTFGKAPDITAGRAAVTPPPEAPLTPAVIAPQIKPIDAPAETPFTPAQTTMTVSDQSAWTRLIDTNANKDYGTAILGFANRWATMMEERMAGGAPLDVGLANETSNIADTEGLSGSMYGFAKGALYQTWKFGGELKALLNPELP